LNPPVPKLLACIAVAMAAFCAEVGHAQSFPTKSVRIMAASVATTSDISARLVGQQLSQRWGQPVVIENRGGAGATLAATPVAKAAPDGHMLLMGETASLAISPHLYENLSYDPQKDLVAITLVAKAPMVIVAHPSFPANTLQELVAHARQHPRAVNYASGGSGTISHLTTALLMQLTSVSLTHVPYKGASAGLLATMAGEVQISSLAASTAVPQIRAGKVKAIAVTGAKRFSELPDVPTGMEAGITGFESEAWFGLLAPAGTPGAVVGKIGKDVVDILNLPATRAAFLAQGAEVAPSTPEEFARFIRSESDKWAKVVKATNAKVE
jgi:tripartite-type tricarboxylate transporter receptor subunit TctC